MDLAQIELASALRKQPPIRHATPYSRPSLLESEQSDRQGPPWHPNIISKTASGAAVNETPRRPRPGLPLTLAPFHLNAGERVHDAARFAQITPFQPANGQHGEIQARSAQHAL